jgi:hypothetical protein
MSHSDDVLDEVRRAIAPPATTLEAARARRMSTLAAARSFRGCLRVYNSGSTAHGTANGDTDADCGLVLDRRVWRELGPDSDEEAARRRSLVRFVASFGGRVGRVRHQNRLARGPGMQSIAGIVSR